MIAVIGTHKSGEPEFALELLGELVVDVLVVPVLAPLLGVDLGGRVGLVG